MDAVTLALVVPPAVTDEDLIARMAFGDRDALGALFDRHHRSLYSFLSRASGAGDSEVEDLVQTTFLEAFRAAQRFRSAASPRTWLFGIGANIAKMYRRASRRRARALERLADEPAPSAAALDSRLADQRALARIEAALDHLPHDLRVAYVMCVMEDTAAGDAARALGVARGTIWRRVHEARRALRAAMGEGGPR
jgi:RNA polymerase sigma-70 factor, ECF subfamily